MFLDFGNIGFILFNYYDIIIEIYWEEKILGVI